MCFTISARTSWVDFLGREYLGATDLATAPFEFQYSAIDIAVSRLDISATRADQRCNTLTASTLRGAMTDPVNGFAPSLERAIAEALWNDTPLCSAATTFRNSANLARCRLSHGTNDIRLGTNDVDGTPSIEFRAHPDRFEVFPDRLEIVLTEDWWLRGQGPEYYYQADRQVDVFDLGSQCDSDRGFPTSINHGWTIGAIP